MICDRLFNHGYSKKQLSKEVHEFLFGGHTEKEKYRLINKSLRLIKTNGEDTILMLI